MFLKYKAHSVSLFIVLYKAYAYLKNNNHKTYEPEIKFNCLNIYHFEDFFLIFSHVV